MKTFILIISVIVILLVECLVNPPLYSQSPKVERLPFQKTKFDFKFPDKYEKRVREYDNHGNPIFYDHKPRIEPLEPKAGKYAFRWIGHNGMENAVVYERPDAIDAVISSIVSKNDKGIWRLSAN